MGSRRAIYNDIAPKPRFFFVRGRKKFPRAGPCPEGPRARPCPREFFCLWTTKNLGFGAISLYIALRDPIYTSHISQLYAQ